MGTANESEYKLVVFGSNPGVTIPSSNGDNGEDDTSLSKRRAVIGDGIVPGLKNVFYIWMNVPSQWRGRVVSFLSFEERCMFGQTDKLHQQFVQCRRLCGPLPRVLIRYDDKSLVWKLSKLSSFYAPTIEVNINKRNTVSEMIVKYLFDKRYEITEFIGNKHHRQTAQRFKNLRVIDLNCVCAENGLDLSYISSLEQLQSLRIQAVRNNNGEYPILVNLPKLLSIVDLTLRVAPGSILEACRTWQHVKLLAVVIDTCMPLSSEALQFITREMKSITNLRISLDNLNESTPLETVFNRIDDQDNSLTSLELRFNQKYTPLYDLPRHLQRISRYRKLRSVNIGVMRGGFKVTLSSPRLSQVMPCLENGVSASLSNTNTPNMIQCAFAMVQGFTSNDDVIHCSVDEAVRIDRDLLNNLFSIICGRYVISLGSINLCGIKQSISEDMIKQFRTILSVFKVSYKCKSGCNKEHCKRISVTEL